MKRILFGTLLASVALCGALAFTNERLKIAVCHATGSESNPYSVVSVNVNSVEDAQNVGGHGNHEGDSWESYVYGGVSYPGRGNMENCDGVADLTPTPTVTHATETVTPAPTDTPTATVGPTEMPSATPGVATTVVGPTGTATMTPTQIEIDTATPTPTATDAAATLQVPCPEGAVTPPPGRVCHSGSG